jgi:hypothetical protein
MKNTLKVLALALLSMTGACKKSLNLEIIESRCKDFRISNASSLFATNGCPGNISSNQLTVTFNYAGDKECLNSIHLVVKFYDDNNKIIGFKTISPDSLHKSSSRVAVGGTSASFVLDFEMNSVADYDKLNYVTVNFNTKNTNLNQSNKLAVVANLPCKNSLPNPSTTDGTIDVKSTTISVSLWDDASEDGDIITIIVNGKIVANNVQIFNSPIDFTFAINPTGSNYISFYAVNEGTSSPNTVAGLIDDGKSSQSFSVGMLQGESKAYTLVYNP